MPSLVALSCMQASVFAFKTERAHNHSGAHVLIAHEHCHAQPHFSPARASWNAGVHLRLAEFIGTRALYNNLQTMRPLASFLQRMHFRSMNQGPRLKLHGISDVLSGPAPAVCAVGCRVVHPCKALCLHMVHTTVCARIYLSCQLPCLVPCLVSLQRDMLLLSKHEHETAVGSAFSRC